LKAAAHGFAGIAALVSLFAMKTPHVDRLPDFPPSTPSANSDEEGLERGLHDARAQVVSYSDDRRSRGLRALREITGQSGAAVVDGLREVAPDLADWIIDFSYGDVMSRPGLDRRTRQLATIAALTSLGHAQPQLKVHVQGALNVGCKPHEILEVILQMTVYCGFPATINALNTAREVLAARDPAGAG
jgi:4-carboxymuconolactone decarboxylase